MGLKALSRLIRGSADYEEGAWTPTLGVMSGTDGVHTYGAQVGRYIRVGNLVWAHGRVTLTSLDMAMSGAVAIKGLPFSTSNVSGLNGVATVIGANVVNLNAAGGYYSIAGRLGPNTDRIELIEMGDAVAAASMTVANFGDTTNILATTTYSVDLV